MFFFSWEKKKAVSFHPRSNSRVQMAKASFQTSQLEHLEHVQFSKSVFTCLEKSNLKRSSTWFKLASLTLTFWVIISIRHGMETKLTLILWWMRGKDRKQLFFYSLLKPIDSLKVFWYFRNMSRVYYKLKNWGSLLLVSLFN